MPHNIRIIHAQDFVRATPEGVLDLEQSKTLLDEIAFAAQGLGKYGILLDLRRAVPELSVADQWYLANHINQLGATYSRKTAILSPIEQLSNSEFFALTAQNRGFQVRAFTSFEQAIEWLIADNNS